MYKKRIGNDIRVLALIRQRIGEVLSPFDMRGRNISVGLVNPRGIETKITEFDVTGDDGSILAFSYYGRDQKVIGVYTIIVRENDKEVGMRTVDKDACFELVKHSYQENIENDGVITIEALEIAMDMAIGTKGDPGEPGPVGPQGPQGPKGDKMTYADLTEADKADLYEGGASLIRPLLDGKQDTIIAGEGISIEGNEISADMIAKDTFVFGKLLYLEGASVVDGTLSISGATYNEDTETITI